MPPISALEAGGLPRLYRKHLSQDGQQAALVIESFEILMAFHPLSDAPF